MDYHRLKLLLPIVGGFIFVACVTEKAQPRASMPKTFFNCSLAPDSLLAHSRQFLEWQKGYSVKFGDRRQGLIVTDWVMDTPVIRHRIMLSAHEDLKGSMLSTHAETQVLQNQDWVELPSNGEREAKLLSELKNYLQTSPTLKKVVVSNP